MFSEHRLQLDQRDVGCCLPGTQDQIRMRLDPPRASVSALPPWSRRSVLNGKLLPADCARRTHAEPHRRLSARQAALDRRYYPIPKIHR